MTAFLPILRVSIGCRQIRARSKGSHISVILFFLPRRTFYFDCKYSVISLKKVYKYNTVKSGFGKSGQRVIGIEAEMWTEWVDSERALEFSVYPRILALSEVAWTNLENRRYKDFLRRLEWYKTYLRKKGINYSRVTGKSGISVSKTIYHMGEDGKGIQAQRKTQRSGKLSILKGKKFEYY